MTERSINSRFHQVESGCQNTGDGRQASTRVQHSHPGHAQNDMRSRPTQTPVETALLAPFLTFQLCLRPREAPRPMP